MRFLAWVSLLVFAAGSYAADLLWPLPGELTLTGGFADSRPDHFHGGVDVHTGPVPLPVIAPADGWIERIAVTPPGYGRALYFRLPDGRTAVFGHLSHFAPALEQMVRDSELACGTYRVDFSFRESSPERCFKAGDTIAYTGKTGVGPAHFHYEIREGDVQTDPLAPYVLPDSVSPVVAGLSWTTLSGFTPWSSGQPLTLKRVRPGFWSAPDVTSREPVAFFLRCYDPGPWNRHAVPSAIRVKVDGRTIFEDLPARIDLLGPRDIYAKLVWPERQRKRDLRRLFRIPYRGNPALPPGWISDVHDAPVLIEIEDRSGNIARIEFMVNTGSVVRASIETRPMLRAGDFVLERYDDPAASDEHIRLVSLSPTEVGIEPANLAFTDRLRLRYGWRPLPRGMFFYERNSRGGLRTLSQTQQEPDSTPGCWILRAGTYGVAVDSIPPELSLWVRGGGLRFRLTDILSGIDDSTVRCTIDGITAIPEFEYDERGGAIWTREPLTSGAHEVEFTAADRAGNSRVWNLAVRVP